MAILLTNPVPFAEALRYARSRDVLPTGLSSAEIREWSADLRRRSQFSARTTHAGYLEDIKAGIEALLEGRANESTIRAWLQDQIEGYGYTPEKGFGDDPSIPPAERGELRDLASNRRVKLILDTQESQAANFGYWRQGQQDLARYAFPCWELVRVRTVEKERDDWDRRWVTAGGTIYDGRMVAPKDDPVWEGLGSSASFEDGLDNPYPPFAFNSGMGVREVSRDDAIALGVIDAGDVPEFQDRALNDELKVNAEQFSPELLAALESDLDATLNGGSLLANVDQDQPGRAA